MNNLLYLSYGAGIHEQETIFSLLSAWRHVPPQNGDLRFLVYTDRPQSFAGLPVVVETLCAEQLTEWDGPCGASDRRKILALQHALGKYSGPAALLDGDTWLRKSPKILFNRIGPGRAVMHLREGRLSEITTPIPTEMANLLRQERFTDSAGRPLDVPPNSAMWNSGVIGIDPSDAAKLGEALNLMDQLWTKSKARIRQWEQFALSFVFEQNMQELREAGDVVFHYWPPYLHDPFRIKLPKIMAKWAGLPLEQRIKKCFAERPRPTVPRRGKVLLKRGLQASGFLRGGAKSSEW